MKKFLFGIFLLICMAPLAHAAFPVNKTAITTITPASTTETTAQDKVIARTIITSNTGSHNFVSRFVSRFRSPYERGEGSRSLFWGLWGLFLWPLGVLAIIHGVRGANSRNPREQDSAILGLILGIGEVLACIAVVVLFFIIVI